MIELYSNGEVVPVKVSKFPAGELYVKVENIEKVVFPHKRCSIKFKFEGSDSLLELALLVNALREACHDVQSTLFCAYFPAARQDRVMSPGEAFGLRVYADIIKSMGFKKIVTSDLHSDVLFGMMSPGLVEDKKQHTLWEKDKFYGKFCIVAPDAGAAKKAQKLADNLGVMCYVASKQVMFRSAHATGSNDYLTDIERLKIAFQADGSFCTGRSSSIRFSFSEPRKIEKLRSILHKVGCTFKEYNLKDGKVEFNIRLDASEFSKTFNWVDFENISSEWAKDFLQELSNWDASVRNGGRFKFDTTTKEVIDVAELVAIAAGYGCSFPVQLDKGVL